uniref:DUF5666 domain-containing protein n=1 Tax=uncultured bacterium fosmid pJB16B1 TaxID=1478054 RepID=A0A0H3UA89_9BACT|nr:hypothetical protein [uncultured bacterium fosmid pJB16B1]
MKRIFTTLAIALMGLCVFAATDVQSLAVGSNVLVGGPGKVSQIEAVGSSATGTITVKRVIDTWAYGTSAATVTNSFTNAVSWTSQTVTNKVVSLVDVYTIVTNAVYTNVVGTATNVVYDTTRRPNGVQTVTNDVVIVKPVWTTSYVPFKTSTVTNDVISHAVYTNTVGTITLSNHVGTLAPSNLYFTAGDVLVIESANAATLRLYSKED